MCFTPDVHFVIEFLEGGFEVAAFQTLLVDLAGIGVLVVIRHHLKK